MDIGTTGGETADRGGGGVHNAQGRGGKDAAAKSSATSLDLTGNMTVGRQADRTSEGGEGERKGGTEGAAIFSVRSAGGNMAKGASGGCKH